MLEILRFDLADQVRRSTNYAFFAFLFGLAVAVTAFFGSRLQLLAGAPVPTLATSPTLIVGMTRWLALIGMLALAGSVFARAATKDYEHDFDGLLVTTGLREWEFVVGRLTASWLTALAVLAAIPLGLSAGLVLPTNVPEHVGAFDLRAHLHGFGLHVMPSVLVAGTGIFAVALLVRRRVWVYLTAFVLVLVPGLLLLPLDWIGMRDVRLWLSLNSAPDLALASTWVPAERNAQAVPLPPELLWSRAIWLCAGAAVASLLARRFRFALPPIEPERLPVLRQVVALFERVKPSATAAAGASPEGGLAAGHGGHGAPAPRAARVRHDPVARLRQLRARAELEFRWFAGSAWFWIAVTAGIALSVSLGLRGSDLTYNVALYPTSANLLRQPMFITVMLLFLAVLAGESLWRERECRIDSLVGVTPAPNWVFFGGLLVALVLIQAAVLLLFLGVALVLQAVMLGGRVELTPFLVYLFSIRLVHTSTLLVPVLLVHVLANNKYVGHLFTLIYVLLLVVFPNFLEQTLGLPKLALYGVTPETAYSDMNGFGDLRPLRWFQAYWGLVAAVLLVLVQLLWVRGADTGARARWRLARRQLSGPARLVLPALVALATATGGWIYVATRVLYRTPRQLKAAEFGDTDDRAISRPQIEAYVQRFRHLEANHPHLVHVAVQMDVRPSAGLLDARGAYLFENRSAQPLGEVLLTDPALPALEAFEVDGQPFEPELERVSGARVRHFQLANPVPPGGRVRIGFRYRRTPPAGFTDGAGEQGWVANGSYLLSTAWLPRVGYLGYLEDDLGERPEPPPSDGRTGGQEDARHGAAENSGIDAVATADAPSGQRDPRRYAAGTWQHRATFEGEICTDPDQTALLPGVLERVWDRDGRRCYAYRSDVPQHLQFHAISGRYAVTRERHGEVDLEVYHHPGHAFNVGALLKAMRTAVDVYGTTYGPYPFRYLRIAEVPYISAAISSPGTAVYGEPFGMMARVDRSQKGVVDLPFFVAAHEAAHQWWGEQVVPAKAPGYAVILEALTQYAAVTAIEREYGPESVRAFLAHEMRQYLRNRAEGSDVPLVEARNQQHVFYRKGAVVMYALRDALGAEALDGALARFFAQYKHGPPFPLASDLMAAVRSAAPPSQQPLIADLLETITFWYLKTERATWTRRDDGKYEVTIEVQASKAHSDNVGKETPIEMGTEMLDVGVLDAKGNFIHLQKYPIAQGRTTVTAVVGQEPAQAGIDPRNLRMDRRPEDNLVAVRPR